MLKGFSNGDTVYLLQQSLCQRIPLFSKRLTNMQTWAGHALDRRLPKNLDYFPQDTLCALPQ